VAARTAIGFVVMGFVGFFVKLIFIPINNIIVGSGWSGPSRYIFCASRLSSIWFPAAFSQFFCAPYVQFNGSLRSFEICLERFQFHIESCDLSPQWSSKACAYAFTWLALVLCSMISFYTTIVAWSGSHFLVSNQYLCGLKILSWCSLGIC